MTATEWDEREVGETSSRPGALRERFIEPPFSVLDTKGGAWQRRRRAWMSLGIQSEIGRGADPLDLQGIADRSTSGRYDGRQASPFDRVASMAEYASVKTFRKNWAAPPPDDGLWDAGGDSRPADEYGAVAAGVSIFDPVLCELMYRWFCPAGGAILDPFAGGSVRGIVAAKLGHPYTGIDLSGAQLAANRAQAEFIMDRGDPMPRWLCGDSVQLPALLPGDVQFDMVFSCPPYFDLEVYSDDPADLSTMDWGGFMIAYDRIIEAACHRLRPGRFAAFVVSEVRGPTGAYRGLVPYTIHAFQRAGMAFYNEAILVNAAGTLPLRASRYMEASRKLGRMHQNILVFLKGEPPRGWSMERGEGPPEPQLALFEGGAA